MSLDADLTWDLLSLEMDGASGGECAEYRCSQCPRLTRLLQRPNRDADWVETYHVEGVSNYYHSAAAAIEAMRANP
jgi:hypothetical protein